MFVRIGENIWSVSAADMKNFGHDTYALKIRAKSAKIVFVKWTGDWYRSSARFEYDDSTRVTKTERKQIENAIVLKKSDLDK